jgi:putative endonuclease
MTIASGAVVVYLLRCSDNSLYTGWTTDIDRRLRQHQNGSASAYTRSRRPVRLACVMPQETRTQARKREVAVKRLTKYQKELLVANEGMVGVES